MTNRKATVKQSDVTRYCKGTQAAGLAVGRVLVRLDGTVEIVPLGAGPGAGIGPDPDELLK